MSLPINEVIQGDCIEKLNSFPEATIDLIFADPPYNLQLQNELHRPNMTKVDAVTDSWDKFDSFAAYDEFTTKWLSACKRVLKPTGSIWVIGSYHNIFRVGRIMQDLSYWILNDVIWIKTNPMPNFRGVRFANAHETLIWASKGKGHKYTFYHQAMKGLNDDKQMRSDWWLLSLATGAERERDENGDKVHSTQKPEALLYRVILSSSKPGDLVLDPFMGSGTTGAVAKKLHRRWIGIEKEEKYVRIARERINRVQVELFDVDTFEVRSKMKLLSRVPFSTLLESGYLKPGQTLYFRKDEKRTARVKPNAKILLQDGFEGSIHQVGSHFMNGSPCNGWDHWYFKEDGNLFPIDDIRKRFRSEHTETLKSQENHA
jgi:modification methylase